MDLSGDAFNYFLNLDSSIYLAVDGTDVYLLFFLLFFLQYNSLLHEYEMMLLRIKFILLLFFYIITIIIIITIPYVFQYVYLIKNVIFVCSYQF